MTPWIDDGDISVYHGDCVDVLAGLPPESVDAVVCDPPYGLGTPPPIEEVMRAWLAGERYTPRGRGFMGREWDAFVPGPEVWRECFRVLKPGGHLLAFFGTRTVDVGGIAIRFAGFEVRDMLSWLYGSGFPKSLDVSKAIDALLGVDTKADDRWVPTPHFVTGVHKTASGNSDKVAQVAPGVRCLYSADSKEGKAWDGWGTALKPACEPVVMARKPLTGTVAANVLEHGTGGINIDACRIGDEGATRKAINGDAGVLVNVYGGRLNGGEVVSIPGLGRWPANVALDETVAEHLGDQSRYFYTAKADSTERRGSKHPTVKPLDLMRWLVRLVTPPGGVVLDPFAGSGTTLEAARCEGFRAIGVEREAEYLPDIARRLEQLSLLG